MVIVLISDNENTLIFINIAFYFSNINCHIHTVYVFIDGYINTVTYILIHNNIIMQFTYGIQVISKNNYFKLIK